MSTPEPESFGFQAEISQLLDLIISQSCHLAVIWLDAISNLACRHFLFQQRDLPS
jgi:hypothetical protein